MSDCAFILHHQTALGAGTGTITPSSLSPLSKNRAGMERCLRRPWAACVTLTEANSSPNSHSYVFTVPDIHLLLFKLNSMRLKIEKTMQHPGICKEKGGFPTSLPSAHKKLHTILREQGDGVKKLLTTPVPVLHTPLVQY